MIFRHLLCLIAEAAALFCAAAAWYAAFTWPHAGLLWVLAGVLSVVPLGWGAFVLNEISADIDRRRAENDRLWGEAERVWVDLDGDGEMDEGELLPAGPPINDWRDRKRTPDPATAEAYRARLRALLLWCYRRQQAGDKFDQGPGRTAFPTYDADMAELTRRGYVRARSTGHMGRLVLPDVALALQRFDGDYDNSAG